MENLKINVIATALLAASQMSHAELTPLSENTMSNLTGQAGITFNINSATVDIGEINYRDEGNLYISGIRYGGAGIAQEARGEVITDGMSVDNFSLVLDVAGASDGGKLQALWGYDGVPTDGGIQRVADSGGTHGEVKPEIGDGDLVLQTAIMDGNYGVDFGILIDRIALGSSTLAAGDDYMGNNPDGTVIASNLIISATGGPIAFVVDNSEGTLNFNTSFEANIDLVLDMWGAKMGIKMHNSRGKDFLVWSAAKETKTASFFHAQLDVGAAEDGLRLDIQDISGDIDVTNITFGLQDGAASIGNAYLTDLSISASAVIYGH